MGNKYYKYRKVSAAQLIPENLFLYDIRKSPYLFQVEIDPIDYCNHNCEWCFTAEFRHDKKIPLDALKRYLSTFCNSGGKSVVFSGGGEPLLYKEIYSKSNEFDSKSICKYLIENEIYVGIITNGYLLNNLLTCDFSITDLSFVRVSLDATNEASHSKLHDTRKSDFSKIKNNIKALIEVRGSLFTPAIGISYVVDSFNNINFTKSKIAEISSLACDLNVDFVQFKHIHTAHKDKAIKSMNMVHSHCVELNWNNVEFWVQTYDSPNSAAQCLISQYIQSIGNESKKFPCCHLFGRTEFLEQTTFLPKGKIIINCDSRVCRYNEMNKMLLNGLITNKELSISVLDDSLNKFGFHPYRYCPTAPDILKPFKSL